MQVLEEHFWFTATTLAFNAFLISSGQWTSHRRLAIALSTIISALAIFLIVDRFGECAGMLKLPGRLKEIPFSEYSLKDVGAVTFYRIKRFVPI